MRWPIKNQIVSLFVALSICIVILVTLTASYFAFRQADAEIRNDMKKITNTLSQANYPITNKTIEQIKGLSGAEFLYVDNKMKPLLATLPNTASTLHQIESIKSNNPSVFDQLIHVGDDSYYVTATKPINSSTFPQSQLFVLYPQKTYARQLRRAWLPPVIAGSIGSCLLGLIGFLAAERITRNLSSLRNQVNVIAQGEFAAMDLPKRNDEIRDLTVSVNQMAAKLREYETQIRSSERQKTFAQLGRTIAHELRNAVTGGKMAIDLHRRNTTPAEQGEYLEVAKKQFRLIEKSVDRFLSFDKPQSARSTELELNEILNAVVELVRPMAVHLKVDLRVLESTKKLKLVGRHGDIEQSFMNLLLNAIEAAASNQSEKESSVTVQLAAEKDMATVLFIDSGLGPTEEMTRQLFDPFATDKPVGLGLGLALTKQIVESHSGTIDWSRQDHHTRFRLKIPLNRQLA